MTRVILLSDGVEPEIAGAATLLPSWRFDRRETADLPAALDSLGEVGVLLITTDDPVLLRAAIDRARAHHTPVIVACRDDRARRRAVELRADEWYDSPASAAEIAARVRSALARTSTRVTSQDRDRAAQVEYEELLYDASTGMPTLPVIIERTRLAFKERGELVVFYLNFSRYAKLEEIYGWEKVDEVLESTAIAVRAFLDDSHYDHVQMMVAFANDDDFIFFQVPPPGAPIATDAGIEDVAFRLQDHVCAQLEQRHGEDVASLFDIYLGYAHVFYNPKIRLERLIYRGIREAANAARSVEQRERTRRVAELKQMMHEGGVYIDYHPIVSADSGKVMGFEALARGTLRSLRSPEVMFEVAAEADLLWELSRLCRKRALEGIETHLEHDQLLFLNVDPHDFADPAFGILDTIEPERVVIEITERTAIKDYPRFRERLKWFRDRGYRFAVDDAGSGYAGLGSIANLEPDFIKLDISLITSIDTNFIKQNLVETMVRFAQEQGAKVIAEGIETAGELETVKRLGVHLLQGFFLHRPARLDSPHAETRAAAQG
jgi:EAL domain-containing protein (putative c-di-GMP-specific phosphodiesterase class I)/DNA-binding response OmpR family regulator